MKSPLIKRIPRELKGEIGKYLVIFIFMAATIGFISGFLVADDSMITAYNESFEKYNIENGNFILEDKTTDDFVKAVENEGVTIYENYYQEFDTDNNSDGEYESTLRIYKVRKDVDKICLMQGNMPGNDDEIVIDRMYADNNKLKVGDIIKVKDKEYTISGLVAFSDYSALFSDNTDMMFDAVKFSVAAVTDEEFDRITTGNMRYNYSWKYDKEPTDEQAEKTRAEELMKVMAANGILKSYIPEYQNQAINFTGDDMGSDRSMMIILLYILIAIMAFIFAVTTTNTIAKESSIIGTLRATGYTRSELTRHYTVLPVIVTLVAALVGNIMGYTWFKDVCASMYYGSYSLPTYKTLWNADAFVLTTVIPVIIMIFINVVIVAHKLKISPLKFLRHDLSRNKNKKATRLPDIKFIRRFRMRIILQNMSGYITLLIGIVFANLLLLFGLFMKPLLNDYGDEIIDNMICRYQYVLKTPVDTQIDGAERYLMTSLKTTAEKSKADEVSVYGIQDDSDYLNIDFPSDGVYASEGYLDKYELSVGDVITLKEKYSDKTYDFKIKGTYNYPAGLAIFMNDDEYRKVFDKDSEYYTGYFSDEELTDIDSNYIYTKITEDDLTKTTRQLKVSMGGIFELVKMFAIIMFIILVYLLTKIIIEKNSLSISMVKILGYTNGEIGRLYVMATTIVVILWILVSLPVSTLIIEEIYRYMMADMGGWIMLKIRPQIYITMFIMSVASYGIIAALQMRKISKIPLDEALKNVE
ncbi:MAG: FtsX-like permease family protein [Lachnospiraceae bacterium]|nr:FtsX-like permease family protein [Lachnospiraceae bacterium]